MLRATLCSLLLLTGPLQGLQREVFDPVRPIETCFSMGHHNRIIFEGADVVQIYSEANGVDVTTDACSGQIFVRCKSTSIRGDLLSFVLDNGEVQDLLIRFSSREPEVLVVCLDGSAPEECSDMYDLVAEEEMGSKNPERILSTIEGILRGDLPDHFESVPHATYERKLKRGVYLRRVAKFVGEDEVLYLYSVNNERRNAVQVSAKELRHEGGNWSFVEKERLAGRSKTLAIVSVGREH